MCITSDNSGFVRRYRPIQGPAAGSRLRHPAPPNEPRAAVGNHRGRDDSSRAISCRNPSASAVSTSRGGAVRARATASCTGNPARRRGRLIFLAEIHACSTKNVPGFVSRRGAGRGATNVRRHRAGIDPLDAQTKQATTNGPGLARSARSGRALEEECIAFAECDRARGGCTVVGHRVLPGRPAEPAIGPAGRQRGDIERDGA